jgi:polysaccharide export outer membrane protein
MKAELSPKTRPGSSLAAMLPRVALLASLVATGCASERVYRAAHLPAELQAPPIANVQTIDLSRLAGPPVSNERIERGDVIEVAIAAGLSSDAVTRLPVRIGEDGAALLPEVGPVQLAGLTLNEAEQAISATCVQRGFYRQPQVTVTMRKQRTNRVTVVGAVNEPGVYQLPRNSSYLLAALVAAGGLAEDAGPKVEIRGSTGNSALADSLEPNSTGIQLASATQSEGVSHVCLNLAESVARGDGGRYIPDGAVITVEKRLPQPYHVIGLVEKPGQFEFPINHEVRVLDAIAQAGGESVFLADKVYVLRSAPDGSKDAVIEVSLRKAKHDPKENLRLQPGDVVSVEQTPATMFVEAIRILPFHMGATIPMF